MGDEASYARLVKPPKLEAKPSSPDSALIFKHWEVLLKGFIAALPAHASKLLALISVLSHENFEMISECTEYEQALRKLERAYVKPPSEIISRYKLQQLKQDPNKKKIGFSHES